MCGIVGIVERDLERPVPADDVERMVRTLNHRGPDEEGSVLMPGVGLGMRRLAIVDIAGGQQPFANEDGTIQVVANGEIYNFVEVKAGPSGARSPVPVALRRRSARPRIRGIRRGVPGPNQGDVRAGAVGLPPAYAAGGARSSRREAVVLHGDAARAAARLRDQGAALEAGSRRASSISRRSISS